MSNKVTAYAAATVRVRRTALLALQIVGSVLLFGRVAAAEKELAKIEDWQLYTDGRVGAFASYANGDAYPRNAIGPTGELVHDVSPGGGFLSGAESEPLGTMGALTQGKIENMRIRSGFVGNTLGIGVRNFKEPELSVTGYFQLWAWIESDARIKSSLNYADARQGYVKLEGKSWGSVTAGRTRALFSRGASDIDVDYGHRWGLGAPGELDSRGPTAGHVGFGVLGSGFAGGFIYGSPTLAGFQLNLGVFDPVQLNGAYSRTKWPRPEAELNFQQKLGDVGLVRVFANGAYQPLYKPDVKGSTTAGGVGYGARIELGPVHLGVAGHFGRGIGLKFALEPGSATLDSRGELRVIDGYYAQSQIVIGPVDLSAGWGIARVFLNPVDKERNAAGNIPHSVIKSQMGTSAGIVWHAREWLHIDVDAFRADMNWYLGEKQTIYFINAGMTFNW